MKHAKNKTIAFGVVLVMCMTAFGVCLTISDGSDATSGTFVSPDDSYYAINTEATAFNSYTTSCNLLDTFGGFYVYSGAPIDITISNLEDAECSKVALNNSAFGTSVSACGLTGSITNTGFTLRGTITNTVTVNLWYYDYYAESNCTLQFTIGVVESAGYAHTVAYVANGGSGSMSNTVVTDSVNGNSSVTLATNGFTKTGYTFVGWEIGNTIYQPGQTVSVGANATVTATAQWSLNTLAIGGVAQQYVVKGAYGSFTATCSSDPAGASVTYSTSDVPSGLSVNISGSTVTYRYTGSLDSNNQKDLSFTLVASASGYSVNSTTAVNIHVVAQLAFTNTPSAGVIGS